MLERRTVWALAFGLALGRVSEAQASRTATVEGDVYVLDAGGDVKKGAANTVYLIRRDSASLAPMIAACKRAKQFEVQAAAGDSIVAIMLRAIRVAPSAGFDTVARNATVNASVARSKSQAEFSDLRRLAAQNAVQTSSTGMAAHYKFSVVPLGAYVLFAEMQLANRRYRWWAEVDVSAPRSITRDLDNTLLADDERVCPPPPPPPARQP